MYKDTTSQYFAPLPGAKEQVKHDSHYFSMCSRRGNALYMWTFDTACNN